VDERPFVADSAGITLQGTVRSPDSPRGVAVLVSGSGPIDRNSDHRRLPLGVMRLVAEALTDGGWASVRYDKRGVGASTGDYWTAGLYDNIADARAVAQRARHEVGGPLVLVGHSEGAVIAAELSGEADTCDGAVLLAGMAGTGEATLRWQAQALESQVPAPARAVMRLLRTSVAAQQDKQLARLAASTRDSSRIQLVSRINAKWFREFMTYDAGAALARAAVPLLAVTGDKDVQVPPSDLETMEAIVGDGITTRLVPDVDHILRHEPRQVSSPRAYRTQARSPLDARVVQAVTQWLDRW
jgi:hypothetical protein